MNAPAPEAENEYSKGARGLRIPRPAVSPRRTGPSRVIAAVALAGAALLVGAEFQPLYTVHLSTFGAGTSTVATGAHNAYAMLPLALLAAGLGLAWARTGARAAVWALGAIGVIALLIALIGDLPDTRAHGITRGLAFASTSAAAGLYLETLGAILVLAAGGAGVLAGLPDVALPSLSRRRRRGGRPPRPRARSGPGGESAS